MLARTWGGVVGLAFDIAGAILVYQGVRTSLDEAQRLETPIVPKTIEDIGGENIQRQADEVGRKRAQERVSARNCSFAGLVSFVVGFSLQAVSSWPV